MTLALEYSDDKKRREKEKLKKAQVNKQSTKDSISQRENNMMVATHKEKAKEMT